jgi:hypothetical protein
MKQILILLAFSLLSCSDDINSISGVWLTDSLESGELGCSEQLLEPYILDIDVPSRTYSLQLDVNSCSGSVATIGSGKIDFESGACTEACCDSDGAQCLLQVLLDAERYEVKGSTLILSTATAKIVFRSKD